MSYLSIEDLSVRYGEVEALKSVDLDVEVGEIVAVIGPSGCGKSSLLRAVAGLQAASSGSISMAGSDLVDVPTHKRDLGLMFQDHALFPHLCVRDNIAFGLRMQKVSKAEQLERVAELLSLVGLAEFGDRRVDELSGGEAQRVALARALAPSPGLMMLDEPLGSLDRLLRQQLVGELRDLFVGLGVTAVHVTHDQAEAFALADRVVILNQGEVLQQGSPVDLWRNPTSAYVARFLGHENLWTTERAEILVPIPAIQARPLQPNEKPTGLVVRVSKVEFSEGRFKVRATAVPEEAAAAHSVPFDSVPFDSVAFESFVFETTEPLQPGTMVVAEIDEQQIVTF